MELQPDVILRDRYKIVRQLGEGGMGAVFLAVDTSLDHEVAVKANRATSPHASAQFMREARLLASLRHPNLPRVTDYFVIDESQFLVMDYIPGDDLGALLKAQGRLPYARVLEWARQLGSALSYLHGQSSPIIHRDIKPGNIKLMPSGEVILVDFGIAKVAEAGAATTTGAMGYTPGYAPPEQYGTGHTGPHSDQYALAATIYNLLTGNKPADSVQRLLGQAGLDTVQTFVPDVPLYVQAVLERALSVRPEDRFASVADFVQALNDPNYAPVASALSSSPTLQQAPMASGASTIVGAGNGALPPVPPPGYPSYPQPAARRGLPGIAIGGIILGVLALVGLGGYFFLFKPAAALPATSTPQPVIATTAVSTPLAATTAAPVIVETQAPSNTPEPTKAPTIGQIAFVSDRGSDKSLQVWLAGVFMDNTGAYSLVAPKQLTTTAGNKYEPAWSPDGNKLLFVADGGNDTGGHPLGLDIFVMDLNDPSSSPVDLTPRSGNDFRPTWSPDGQWIAFVSDSREDGLYNIWVMHPDGTGRTRVSTNWEEFDPAWSPDSKQLLFVMGGPGFNFMNIHNTSDFTVDIKPTPTATASPLDRTSNQGRPGNPANPAWSPDGSKLVYTSLEKIDHGKPTNGPLGRISLLPIPLKGDSAITPLTVSGKDREANWSPDSKYIAFTSERSGNIEVWIMQSNGSHQLNASNDPGVDMQPAWRPGVTQ